MAVRIAFVPDGDFFEATREGTVSVATDTIAEFPEKGVQLSSGEVIEADIIVTASRWVVGPVLRRGLPAAGGWSG